MNKIPSRSLTALLVVMLATTVFAAERKIPSIIWILLDQVPADSFGCYGHPFCKTPNFDRLAAQGVKFNNAVVVGMPCVPSRVSYNAGLYPHQTGVYNNSDKMRAEDGNLPRLLHQGGIRECILISKDHFNTPPEEMGYTSHVEVDAKDTVDASLPVVRNRGGGGAIYSARSATRPEMMYSGRCIDEAIKNYDRLCSARTPFFLCVSINRPHPETVVSSPFYEMYDANVPLPEKNPGELKDKPDSLRVGSERMMEEMSPENLRLAISSHYGSLSEVDFNLGRLLERIKPAWEAGDLIVAVSADHGGFRGRYWRLEKGFGYRDIVCVPFIISQPGRLKPKTVDSVVESIDFLPTLLDLCGLQADKPLPGVSLVPLMDGKVQEVKTAAFNEDGDRKTVRTRQWHYSLYDKKSCPDINRELYDLVKDPGETKNLAYDPACAAVVKQCEDLIAERLGLSFPEKTTAGRKKTKKRAENKAR
jgi:iduronate 2-sulfatase